MPVFAITYVYVNQCAYFNSHPYQTLAVWISHLQSFGPIFWWYCPCCAWCSWCWYCLCCTCCPWCRSCFSFSLSQNSGHIGYGLMSILLNSPATLARSNSGKVTLKQGQTGSYTFTLWHVNARHAMAPSGHHNYRYTARCVVTWYKLAGLVS